MTEGLDLHLGVDKTAGFVERALETALREALIAEGWLTGAPGSGTRVADLPGTGPAGGQRAGVDLYGLHAQGYWREPGGDWPAALILGYATPPPHACPGPWMPSLKWYKKFTHADDVALAAAPVVPEGAEAMTVRIDLPPGDPGNWSSGGTGGR